MNFNINNSSKLEKESPVLPPSTGETRPSDKLPPSNQIQKELSIKNFLTPAGKNYLGTGLLIVGVAGASFLAPLSLLSSSAASVLKRAGTGFSLLSPEAESKIDQGALLIGTLGFALLASYGDEMRKSAREKQDAKAHQIFQDTKRSLLDPERGDPNIHFLGGTAISEDILKETLNEGEKSGKVMERGNQYLLENNTIITKDGKEFHVGTTELNKLADEWVQAGGKGSFNDFVLNKMENEPELKQILEQNEVRYFDTKDRANTKVSFVDGKPVQIGLDTPPGQKATPLKPNTSYAFVLSNQSLFMSPKVKTDRGRIQHSSFLKGEPVKSAGVITTDNDGNIIAVNNASGHYTPTEKETLVLAKFLKENLSPEDLKKVRIFVNHNKGWQIGVANFLDQKLNIKWGITEESADLWLKKQEGKSNS